MKPQTRERKEVSIVGRIIKKEKIGRLKPQTRVRNGEKGEGRLSNRENIKKEQE